MATQYCIATGLITPVFSLAVGVTKTVVELPSSSTAHITVIGLEFSFSAASAGSCVVEWNVYTTTGTGSAITPLKYGTGQGAAANVGTVKVINTAAATGLSTGGLPSWIIPLPGMYSILFPAGREFFWPVSTLRCLNMTSTVATNVRANVYFEQ